MDQLPPSSMNAAGEGDSVNRNEARDSLFLVAQFRLAGRRRDVSQVRVRNLSAGGLMAEVPQALPDGTPVEIEVRGCGWVPGRIAWSVAGRVGIAFDHPIDPMQARKPVSTGSAKPSVYVKPILPIL